MLGVTVAVVIGVTTSDNALMGEVNGPPSPADVLSIAVTLTVNVPDCDGVPEMTPLELLMVSPEGRPVAVKV